MRLFIGSMAFFLSTAFFHPLTGEWSQPIDLFTAPYAQFPTVGVDAAGNAVIVAIVADEGNLLYEKAIQLVNGIGQNIQNFAPIGVHDTAHSISVNAAGNAAVVWLEADLKTSYSFVRSSVLIDNSWTSPSILSNEGTEVQPHISPTIHLDTSDKALSVWACYNPSDSAFNIQDCLFSSTWGTPHIVFSDLHFLSNTASSGSPSGQTLAAWYRLHPNRLVAGYFDDNQWNVQSISPNVINGIPLIAVAMNASNQALILWSDRITDGLRTVFFTQGLYEERQSLYRPCANEEVYDAAIAIDPFGNALALWTTLSWQNGTFKLMANRYSNGAWGAPRTLDTVQAEDAMITSINIQMDDQGNGCAVWEKDDASGSQVYANRYAVNTHSWLPDPELLSSPDEPAGQPRLALNGSGDATVVWSKGLYGNQTIQAILFKSHSRCDGFPWGQSEAVDSASRDASIVEPAGIALQFRR